MQTWKTLNKSALLSFGKWLTVERHTVALPDGQIIDDWPWIVTPDYVNVVAFTPQRKILCFRQVKYALEGETLATVGGYIEPGEDPLSAARRELIEETGYTASEWISLGRFTVDANRGAGIGHFFLARNAVPVAEPNADDLEEQQLILLDRSEAATALRNGQFKAMAWTAILALALLYE